MYKAINAVTQECECQTNNYEYIKQFVDGYAGLIRFYIYDLRSKMIVHRNW